LRGFPSLRDARGSRGELVHGDRRIPLRRERLMMNIPRIPRRLGAILIPLLLLLAACGGSEDAARSVEVEGAGRDAAAATEVTYGRDPSAAPGDYSIFHLESTWWDQHGERRPLS